MLDGEKGLFVSMPQSKDKEGNYHDIAFPVNGDLRKQITSTVLEEYGRVSEKKPLAQGLQEGAAKAAEQAAPSAGRSAKSKAAPGRE